ncbi:hypothetical protein BC827DRAFT_1272839 [Russula dissimulans]|nr:hypothetical protein BC827DRAFT_1272839 [Russula dissimulans]
MDLGPVPPPASNPNPEPNPLNPPPGKPPDPFLNAATSGIPPISAPDNPFRGPIPEEVVKAHNQSLTEALDFVRTPFRYGLAEPLRLDRECWGGKISPEDFNAAAKIVLTAMEMGDYPKHGKVPLDPTNWARLACVLTAAIGRGLCQHCEASSQLEKKLDKVRADVPDNDPITKEFPTLFHRLAATASHLEMHISPDIENYADWYYHARVNFDRLATKAAATDIEEAWRQWKADQIDRRAAAQEAEIAEAVKGRNYAYFFAAAESIGLKRTQNNQGDVPPPILPATGGKRTVSGSAPIGATPHTTPRRSNPIRTTRSSPSLVATPRGPALAPLEQAPTW